MNPAHILLIDDNPGDQRLTREALKDANFQHHLHIAEDGSEAIELLERSDEGELPSVDLIILDLNLPRKHGREVLQEIKSNPRWKEIPVVIVSSSRVPNDEDLPIEEVDGHFTKPMDFEMYFRLIQSLARLWQRESA